MSNYNQIETKEDFYVDNSITSVTYNNDEFY